MYILGLYSLVLGAMITTISIDLYCYYRDSKLWGKFKSMILIILQFFVMFWSFCGVLVFSETKEKVVEDNKELPQEIRVIKNDSLFIYKL